MTIEASSISAVLIAGHWIEVDAGTFELEHYAVTGSGRSYDDRHATMGFTFQSGPHDHDGGQGHRVSGPMTTILAVRHSSPATSA